MTWLAIDRTDDRSDLEAVLCLHPETATALRSLVAAAQASVEPMLFQLAARRMATVLGVPEAVLAEIIDLDASPDGRASRILARWPSSPEITRRERVSVAFAEQFVIDHNQIADQDIDEMLVHHTSAELFRFQVSIGVVDRVLRLCRIFEIEPQEDAR
jgi:alkylhydroperoxidase family enzyme